MLSWLCGRVLAASALMAAVWFVGSAPDSGVRSGIPSIGGPHGPVRILRFYATTGAILRGDKAELCYGVANAKSVRISPSLEPVAPAANKCFEIVPEHTTHYTILAEGFDGDVVSRAVTLIVETAPAPRRGDTNMAVAANLPFTLVSGRPVFM
ncbi:MAG TPA: hypothetical protein VHW09_03755 [Bryobacteraceae bacterium]|jgi:hypothetical protein|nr:hypothetical protein [Bryobacteraceae bacterium]